jgi:predicted RNase H-like nuclease (RuvC/YqgF family)
MDKKKVIREIIKGLEERILELDQHIREMEEMRNAMKEDLEEIKEREKMDSLDGDGVNTFSKN